jgi:hypothetical protein
MATAGHGGANCEPGSPKRSEGATGPHGAAYFQIPLGSTRFVS